MSRMKTLALAAGHRCGVAAFAIGISLISDTTFASGAAACKAAPQDKPAYHSVRPGMSFANEAEALTWIARRSQELGIGGVNLARDATDSPIGLRLNSLASDPNVQQAEQRLFDELGGTDGALYIRGKRHALHPDAAGGNEVIRQAATPTPCSGSLCTDDFSFQRSYFVYREIGSTTKIKSGGAAWEYQTIDCWSECPAGWYVAGVLDDGTNCAIQCGRQTSDVSMTINQTYFTFTDNGLLLPAFNRSGYARDTRSLTVKESGWLAIELPVGVCASHVTSGTGGSTGAVTSAGRIPLQGCQ